MWWTSTFTDPLNNIVYDTMWLPEETFGKSLQHENGKIYFTRVKSAQHGASQKALERLRITPDSYKQSPAEQLRPDHVLKVHESSNNDVIRDEDHQRLQAMIDEYGPVLEPKIDSNELLPSGIHSTHSTIVPSLESTLESAPVQPLLNSKMQQGFKSLNYEVVLFDNETVDDQEGYTIQSVSSSVFVLANDSAVYSKTLDRIMEAWEDRVATEPWNEIDSQRMPLLQTPIEQQKQILCEAILWFNGVQQPKKDKEKWWIPTFSRPKQFSTVTTGTRILHALAKANKIAPCPSIESTATMIFDFMAASDEKLSIESYNEYFECFNGISAMRKAKKIQQQMSLLLKSNQLDDPKPNSETRHIAMRAWSQVGGKVAINAIEKLMSQESSQCLPTREAYAALLAATSGKGPDTSGIKLFNSDEARRIINQMQAACIERSDESLRPDTELFNIPIVSDAIDNYEVLFSNGFLKKCPKLWKESSLIEAWVSQMGDGDDAVQPDARSYGAVIQSWVLTGTEEGLEIAESWALKLLRGSLHEKKIQAVLSPFHPILAAYAFTGNTIKVKEWIDRLEMAGDSRSPQIRLRALLITANSNAIKLRLQTDVSLWNFQNCLSHHAEACSSLLTEFTSDIVKFYQGESTEPLFLEAVAFHETAKAWGYFTRYRQENGGDVESCVKKAMHVQELLKSTISHLGTVDCDPELVSSMRQQLVHLGFNTIELNTILLEVLGSTVKKQKEPWILEHPHVVDSMLRHSAECGRTLHEISHPQQLSGEVIYSDHFSYHPNVERRSFHDSVAHFCTEIAILLQFVSAEKQSISDIIQLCDLVLKLVARDTSSNENKRELTVLYTAVGEVFSNVELKEERAALLQYLVDVMEVSPTPLEADLANDLKRVISRINCVRKQTKGSSCGEQEPQLSSDEQPTQEIIDLSEGNESQKQKSHAFSGGTHRISRRGGTKISKRKTWS